MVHHIESEIGPLGNPQRESGIPLGGIIPFPFIVDLPELDMETLVSPEYIGVWWLMGIAILHSIFNYFLGEELLFRGILLPKMQGTFGKWDWAANAVLFAFYHMHKADHNSWHHPRRHGMDTAVSLFPQHLVCDHSAWHRRHIPVGHGLRYRFWTGVLTIMISRDFDDI